MTIKIQVMIIVHLATNTSCECSAWRTIKDLNLKMDANRRMRWQLDTTSVEYHAPSRGRTGVGWESHCDHGSYRLNHCIIDSNKIWGLP